jgi:cytochrome P450
MLSKSCPDFFTGGSGTMSKTLAFGFLYCLQTPEVMEKVRRYSY